MSALGQKQTFALQKAMSALPPESLTLFDHLDRAGDTRLPPVERTERKQKIKRLVRFTPESGHSSAAS